MNDFTWQIPKLDLFLRKILFLHLHLSEIIATSLLAILLLFNLIPLSCYRSNNSMNVSEICGIFSLNLSLSGLCDNI